MLGHTLAYEHQLALVGETKDNVDRPIYGGTIGVTHNFKGTKAAAKCTDPYCGGLLAMRNPSVKKCPECGQPTQAVRIAYRPSEIREKYTDYIFGVDLKDGTRKWFKEPVAPTYWYHTYGETVD